jgi:hypothetical protein
VSTVAPDNRVGGLVNNFLDFISDFFVHHSWLTDRYGLFQTPEGLSDQILRLLAGLSYTVGLVEVCMETSVENGDVHVHNVASLERPRVWDAVADDFVYGGTKRLGEAVIVERRGVGIMGDQKVMDRIIDCVGGNPWLHVGMGEVEGLTGKGAGGPEVSDVLRLRHSQDVGTLSSVQLRFWDSGNCVVWTRDILRCLDHGSHFARSKGSGKLEIFEGRRELLPLSLFRLLYGVDQLVERPKRLKAFLGAEKGVGDDSKVNTSWTPELRLVGALWVAAFGFGRHYSPFISG